MKLTCNIVQDLLPLYQDKVCSPDSRAAVEEHLKNCPACRGGLENTTLLPEEELSFSTPEEQKPINCFKKVRRRWAASLLAVLLVLPLLLLTFNQIRGQGICYTNSDEILLAKRYVSYLQKSEYGKAAEMFDYSPSYHSILNALDHPLEAYGPNFVTREIDGEIWYQNPRLIDIDWDAEADDLWWDLVWNQHYGILITETQMEKFAAREPAITKNDQGGYTVNERKFYPLVTPWGTYLAESSGLDSFLQSDREPVDYGISFTLIPEQMYLDAQPYLQAEAEEIWTATHNHYGAVLDMTEEEFHEHMLQNYTAALEDTFSTGITLNGNSYATAYRADSSGWTVGIQSAVIIDGTSQPIIIYLRIQKGRITDLALSYSDDSLKGSNFIEALHPRY